MAVVRRTPGPPFKGRELCQMREDPGKWGGGGILRDFLLRTRGVSTLPEGMMWGMLFPQTFISFPNEGGSGGGR